MSKYDYDRSLELGKGDPPFASLIMAALLKADDRNYHKLMDAWPEIVEERRERYHAPGGYLEHELPTHRELE